MNKAKLSRKRRKDPIFNWPITRERYRQVLIAKRSYYDLIVSLSKDLECALLEIESLKAQLLKEQK